MVSINEPKLTTIEIPLLARRYNLTDGHAFRGWSPQEDEIISRASEILRSSSRLQQHSIEAAYVDTVMQLGDQTVDRKHCKYLICTTASESIEIVANYLRMKRRSVAFIEPSFDNLADILRRHGIQMFPFPDTLLAGEGLEGYLASLSCGAIFLVSPNNPTGRMLTATALRQIVEHCVDRQIILIMDTCFRAYVPAASRFDQYALLNESGVDYILIEDTGKTWPTLELKASILAASRSISEDIFSIYADFLLHSSPFTIRLLTEFVRLSISDDSYYLRRVVADNRRVLNDALAGLPLSPQEGEHTSVAWLKSEVLGGGTIVKRLASREVFILPGNRFFWSDESMGEDYVRVALVRDQGVFREACEVMSGALRTLF